MKKPFRIIILIFVFCGLGIAYWLSMKAAKEDNADNLPHTEDTMTLNELKTGEADDKTISPNRTLSANQAISMFESAKDAKSAMDIIDQLFSDGNDGLAKALLLEMHGRCQYKDDFSSPIGDSSSPALLRLKEYCRHYDSSHYEIDDKYVPLNPNPNKLTFSDETDIDVISKNFLEMLKQVDYASTSFIRDAIRTSSFYSQEFNAPLQLGQSNVIAPYDIHTVQTAAIELFACEINGGGCGSNSYNVQINCVTRLDCEQNWSLMDYYQNTLSPVNFNEVMNVLNFIRRYVNGT